VADGRETYAFKKGNHDDRAEGAARQNGEEWTGCPERAPGNHSREIARPAAQVRQIVTELQVQLTRIGQIQMQLDRLSRGSAPDSAAQKEPREDN
jgi:hypothetical protein